MTEPTHDPAEWDSEDRSAVGDGGWSTKLSPPESRQAARRHPAQVTADRLTDHLVEFADYLTNRDRVAFERVRIALAQIADGER